MSIDIFSDYIDSIKQGGGTDRESETINILKEISTKLDKLAIPRAFAETNPTQGMYEVDLAVVGGRVILPDNGIFDMNIYVRDGKVLAIGDYPNIRAKKVIQAQGKYVAPGIIDPHVHLGLFAPLKTELVTESKSALIGGVTTIGCYFGGTESHFKTFPRIAEDVETYSHTDIIPHFIISSKEQCREIGDYINHLEVTSYKIYMNGIPGLIPDVDDGFILDVMGELQKSGKKCILCAHAENKYLCRRARGKVEEEKGEGATVQDWTDTHPDMAEEEAVMRLAYLAEKSRVRVYFVHISSKIAIQRLKKLKPNNKYINVETTSPYLSVTKNSRMSNEIKMEPPFRDAEDVEELWKAVEDGIVDTIGTDNVTMTKSEKNVEGTLWEAIAGYPALETHLTSLLSEGVKKRGLDIERLIGRITKRPAEIFGVYPQKGTLLPGSDADMVILDMDMAKEIRAEELHSRSDFSLFEGKRLEGWPVTTIKAGQVVVENGCFKEVENSGKIIRRQ